MVHAQLRAYFKHNVHLDQHSNVHFDIYNDHSAHDDYHNNYVNHDQHDILHIHLDIVHDNTSPHDEHDHYVHLDIDHDFNHHNYHNVHINHDDRDSAPLRRLQRAPGRCCSGVYANG